MRSRIVAVVGVFVLPVLLAHVSYASGSVLLPPTSGSGGAVPNLGLGGTTDTASQGAGVQKPDLPNLGLGSSVTPPQAVGVVSDTQTKTPTKIEARPTAGAPTTSKRASPEAIQAAVQSLSTQTGKAIKLVPVPTSTPARPAGKYVERQPQPIQIVSPVSEADTAKILAARQVPTMVIKQPDMPVNHATHQKSLPLTLQISVGEKSVYGVEDMKLIADKLGIKKPSSSCVLSIQGVMQTDKTAYVLNAGAVPRFSVGYAGIIKGYMMSAAAYCKTDSLPNNGGVITQIGDYYVVNLQSITCQPPNRQVTSLTVTYNGSSTAQCEYE